MSIDEFINLSCDKVIIDVRSPSEYLKAHIPGAINLPLFTDEERAVVGTLYKQQSREEAIKAGLDYFGPRMRTMVEEAERIANCAGSPGGKTLMVHCWRGGMRSSGVAWLLDLYGFNVYTLEGGYKAFRNYVLNTFEREHKIKLLGGYTGSGKTGLLHRMSKEGHPVIDLEGLASHKGSAFGNIGMPDQPSPEMFENLLATELQRYDSQNQEVWMEDESQRLGTVNVPHSLWTQMLMSPVYFVDVPFESRLDHIVEEYGKLDKERLVNAIIRITKRLGGVETKNAVNYLIENNVRESFRILLKYYDKYYEKSLHNKPDLEGRLHIISCEDANELRMTNV